MVKIAFQCGHPRELYPENRTYSTSSIDTTHKSQIPFRNPSFSFLLSSLFLPSFLPSLPPSLLPSFLKCLDLQLAVLHIGEGPIIAEAVTCIDRVSPLYSPGICSLSTRKVDIASVSVIFLLSDDFTQLQCMSRHWGKDLLFEFNLGFFLP